MPLLILLIVASAAMLAPGLLIGPSPDAAVFSHVGGGLLHGVAPYVGAWDHKPPGIYLISAAAHAVLGWLGPWTADWVISLAATVGLGAAIAVVLKRLGVMGWPRTLAVVGATIMASQYILALGGGLTEPPATLLVGCALVACLGPASRARAAASGALVGMALLISIQALPGGVVVLVLALFVPPAKTRVVRAGFMAVGLMAPLVLAVAWLAAIGALPAAADAIVWYSAAYRGSSGGYGTTLGAPVAAWSTLALLFLLAPAFLGAASMMRDTGHRMRRHAMIASMLWVAASMLLFVAQGRYYGHYAIPLAVPLGVLAGIGLERVWETLVGATSAPSRAVVLLPLVGSLAISVASVILTMTMLISPVADRAARTQAVAQRIDDLPGTTLLVWGNEPRLYDLAGRLAVTRYVYLLPLTTPGYTTSAMIDQVKRQLAADPPDVVVDAGSDAPGQPGFLPLLIDRPILTDGRDLDLLDPLRAFVAEHYVLVDTVAGWPIYVLARATM